MEYPVLKGLDKKIVQDILVSYFKEYENRDEKNRGLELLVSYTNLGYEDVRGISHDSIAYNLANDLINTSILTEILYYLMKNLAMSQSHYEYLKAIYYQNGYDPEGFNEEKIVTLDSLRIPNSNELAENWLKKYAPTEVYQKIQEAFNELSKNTDDALEDCRQALEKLTINAHFTPALKELCDKGIIKKSSGDKKNDYEMLQTVYHYASTLGSHTANKIPKPTIEQAEFGYMLTQSALWYLIQQLRGIKSLKEWVEIK